MKRIILTISAGVLAAGMALAQAGPPPGPPPGPGGPHHGFGPGMWGGAPGASPWKVVANAPYSAAMTEQTVETLPNGGGTITHGNTGTVARDKYGRTYVQQTFTGGAWGSQGGPKTVIFLVDPVAGYSYTLYPDKNLAVQRPFKAPSGNPPAHNRPADPNESVSTSSSTYQSLPVTVTTKTRTIAANTEGNSVPLTWNNVVMYSPDLQIVVSSTRSDPRFGVSTYALTNIVPGDPTNVSFSVPAGYTIQTEPSHGPRGPRGPQQ